MRSLSWMGLALGGSLTAAIGFENVPGLHEPSILPNVSHVNASATDTSLPASTTIELITLTHTLSPGATDFPEGFEPDSEITDEKNKAWRRDVESKLHGAETLLFEVRGKGDVPFRPNVHQPDEYSPMKIPRQWIFCHARGYDPNVIGANEPMNQCLWDFANGDLQGEFLCYDRMFYFTLQNWQNRTQGIWGCSPCFNHCHAHGRAWCDCTNQSDLRVPKVWCGWEPIKHTFTKGWQNTITVTRSFLGKGGYYSKRVEAIDGADDASGSGAAASSTITTPPPVTGPKTQQSGVPVSSNSTTDIEFSKVQWNSVNVSSRNTTETESSTTTRKSAHKSHITPAPRKWKRGGSPEWHTYTPAENNTAAAEYKSKLIAKGLMDHEGDWAGPYPQDSLSNHDKHQRNGTDDPNPNPIKGNDSTVTTHINKRLIPPWHWSEQPPPGLTCFSQGYSPDINESLYHWLENTARNERTGVYEMDVPWNVNISILLVEWDSTIDCFNACKDCVAWGIFNSRNLMWCDFHIGWITNCHIGYEPVEAWMLARTDFWGEYITGAFATLTDHWYTTPTSWIMASQDHITPWLPIRPSATSTHFFANASSQAATGTASPAVKAVGQIKYWDVYCSASYAGFELSDWVVTHTRTDYEWTGWYTEAANTEMNAFTAGLGKPTSSSSSSTSAWMNRIYSTVYPTACPTAGADASAIAKRSHPRARAIRLDVHSGAKGAEGAVDAVDAEDGTMCADCQSACHQCIDWAFDERRANVSCIVKVQNVDGPGLCEADYVLSLDPTGSQTIEPTTTTTAWAPSWPASWTGPKIFSGHTYYPHTATVTSGSVGSVVTSTTTEWRLGTAGTGSLLSAP